MLVCNKMGAWLEGGFRAYPKRNRYEAGDDGSTLAFLVLR